MRAHEIATLNWSSIDTEKRVAKLDRTKNGEPREVPLSSEAIRILMQFEGSDPPFGFTSGAHLSTNWFALKQKAGADGLTFHDSRHEAITRLSRKLDVLALARMVGHKNIKELMTYYYETAEELATRLE
ncbi:site-specific integrase [Paracoccus aminovorans]|uniref:site-specific integrase n=1 Tax=Paracoccus aminovorans TaxID=34004 RepID=UPI002B260E3D|nr:site-specific integrase [Paracoccus aminovorans]